MAVLREIAPERLADIDAAAEGAGAASAGGEVRTVTVRKVTLRGVRCCQERLEAKAGRESGRSGGPAGLFLCLACGVRTYGRVTALLQSLKFAGLFEKSNLRAVCRAALLPCFVLLKALVKHPRLHRPSPSFADRPPPSFDCLAHVVLLTIRFF